jgi:hypothetical protein
MVLDETRGVIQKSYQVNDAIASYLVIENLYFMQILVPQVIDILGDEPVIVNTNRRSTGAVRECNIS